MAMYKSAVATDLRPVNNTCVSARLNTRSRALVFFGCISLSVTKFTRLTRYASNSCSIMPTSVPNFSKHFLKGLYWIKANRTCSVSTYSCLSSRASLTAFSRTCSISGLFCMESFKYVYPIVYYTTSRH